MASRKKEIFHVNFFTLTFILRSKEMGFLYPQGFPYWFLICRDIKRQIKKSNNSIGKKIKQDQTLNKAMSMMRGKSPPSDAEMPKKLNFVAAILD